MSEAPAYGVTPLQSHRRGFIAAIAGCTMVSTVLLLAALVIWLKPQFGWMVGPWFLPILSLTLILGALAVLYGAWKLRSRRSWHWIVLLVWALIGLTAPAFGIMFLLPLGVVLVSLPVVIVALATLWPKLR